MGRHVAPSTVTSVAAKVTMREAPAGRQSGRPPTRRTLPASTHWKPKSPPYVH